MSPQNFDQFVEDNDLEPPPDSPHCEKRPLIKLPAAGRPIGAFANELGQNLASQDIFARNGQIFKIKTEAQKLEPVTATWFRTWAEKHVCCIKIERGRKGDDILPSTMSEDAANAVLQSPQFLEHVRRIERFHPCQMPMILNDGRLVLLPEGYHQEGATYTASGVAYDHNMSIENARLIIEQAFAEFPFAEEEGRSKAVAVAAMLTVYAGAIMQEGAMRPVFLYLGNAEGTGKTTAAKLAGIPLGTVAVESAPTEESEWQKKLLSAVIGGRSFILLDNLKGTLNSPTLEAFTSASRINGRILGKSEEFEGPACPTILITGNSLTISPDMRRRTLCVELFTHELRAENRHFFRRLDDAALRELRPNLLAACWALVQSWDKNGRPPASRLNASFPGWCDTIGGIVENAGFGCPTAPAELSGMGDTDTIDIEKLGGEMIQGQRYAFGEIIDLCAEHGIFERFTTFCDEPSLNQKSMKSTFAKILKRYDRRFIADGVRFYLEGEGKTRRYVVQ